MTLINNDGQPLNKGFCYQRNVNKYVFSLLGLLNGITADKKLHDLEVLALDNWLKEQQYIDKSKGDFLDIIDAVNHCIQNEQLSIEGKKDLIEAIMCVIEYNDADNIYEESHGINELLGFLNGIAADNEINEQEIKSLKHWLGYNDHLEGTFPYDQISRRLKAILADGIITEQEKIEFLNTVKLTTGQNFTDTGLAYGASMELFSDKIDDLFIHEDEVICLTGKFLMGSRKTIEQSLIKKGAAIKTSVSSSVTLLIIGSLASRDWIYTSHGRKIEKAIEIRKKHPLKIICESKLQEII